MNTYIIFSANYKVGSVSDEINELKHNIAINNIFVYLKNLVITHLV